MNDIKVGDNGTVLEMTIQNESGSVVDIRGTTITCVIKYRDKRIEKTATITSGDLGQCEVTLDSEDIQNEGNYIFQGHVKFQDETEFSSDINRFSVTKKL